VCRSGDRYERGERKFPKNKILVEWCSVTGDEQRVHRYFGNPLKIEKKIAQRPQESKEAREKNTTSPTDSGKVGDTGTL